MNIKNMIGAALAPLLFFGSGALFAPGTASAAANPYANVVEDTGTSLNWSGYAATGGTYSAVIGTWTVPTVTASALSTDIASDATWVGIGGLTTLNLIQAGTQQVVDGTGAVTYEAWIEMLPHASKTVALDVHPGDSITASIGRASGKNQWDISIRNNTTGKSYNTHVAYAASMTSAEWIEEVPTGENVSVGMDNFSPVAFTQASTVKDGSPVNLSDSGAQPITMVDFFGTPIAAPSPLTTKGNAFTVARTDASVASSETPQIQIFTFGARHARHSFWRRTGR